MENSSDYYYEKLKETPNPGAVLAAMMCSMYGMEVTRSEIIICNKLVKIFGRFITYFSIIDMIGSQPEKLEGIYPYLYTICKRRFEMTHLDYTIQSQISLLPYLKSLTKEIESMKYTVLNPPSPEGLDNDSTE
jgi:hypothetical protein